MVWYELRHVQLELVINPNSRISNYPLLVRAAYSIENINMKHAKLKRAALKLKQFCQLHLHFIDHF